LHGEVVCHLAELERLAQLVERVTVTTDVGQGGTVDCMGPGGLGGMFGGQRCRLLQPPP